MTENRTAFKQKLFIERLSELFGFDLLANKIPFGNLYPPYLYLATFLFVDFVIINGYQELTGGRHIIRASPTAAVGPIAVILAGIGIKYMSNKYAGVVSKLRVTDTDRDIRPRHISSFKSMVPFRTKVFVYLLSAGALYTHILLNVGINNILAFEGPTALVNRLFVWQIGYLPFVVEFGLLYFSIHFSVPRRIKQANLRLFFYDPRNMGGFAPVGQLLKHSYYLYTFGLLLFFLLTYGPFILDIGDTVTIPGITEAAFFSLVWFVGILSIGYSMWTVHQIMSSQKEMKIREIEEEIREIIDNPYEINSSSVSDENKLDDLQRRLKQVRGTRVYPATFTMWSQIGISVLLPQALQLAVQTTL